MTCISSEDDYKNDQQQSPSNIDNADNAVSVSRSLGRQREDTVNLNNTTVTSLPIHLRADSHCRRKSDRAYACDLLKSSNNFKNKA